MLTLRKADDRGQAEHGWLSSRHTFSFGHYHDPRHMGVSVLRVINDDRVAPGRGFATHSHQDMEILSYVLEGELAHRDSMGNGSVLRPGQVQLMSAGRGVTHSEFNHSQSEFLHFLQIWILPDRRGEAPSYQELSVSDRPPGLGLIVSPTGDAGSLKVKQDVRIHAGPLNAAETWTCSVSEGRVAYVHLARGAVTVNGANLTTGDGAALLSEDQLNITAGEQSELLVFDLPSV